MRLKKKSTDAAAAFSGLYVNSELFVPVPWELVVSEPQKDKIDLVADAEVACCI